MGDRISISFVNGNEESIAFFAHWDGMDLLDKVREYLVWLSNELTKRNQGETFPIDRLEPNTIMVDFIRWFTKSMDLIESNYYFGKDMNDGDNSDNGHHKIDLIKEVEFLRRL